MKTSIWKSIPKHGLAIVAGILLGIIAPACAQTTNADEPVPVETSNAADAIVTPPTAAPNLEAATNATVDVKKPPVTRVNREAVVAIGSNAELKANEVAEAVVAICGNAIAKGEVTDAVVAVMGNVEVSGEGGDAVVAVMGNVKLLPGARVRGDVVSVGGTVEKAEGASIEGQVQEVNIGIPGLPSFDWLSTWVKECVFKLRPLAPSVGWVWGFAGVFFLLYALVALALPRPVELCVQEITQRPLTTILMGLLTLVLVPVISIILAVTVVGGIVIPFALIALALAAIIGKVALLQYLGRQITRHFGGAQQPFLAFVVGWLIITLLYMVPILGLMMFAVTGMWALGAAVMATFGGARREMPPRNTPPSQPTYASGSTPPVAGLAPMPMTAAGTASPSPEVSADSAGAGFAAPSSGEFAGTPPAFAASAVPTTASAPMAMPDAWALPRAGFWERMGAAFLDVVLVSILGGLIGGPPLGFLVALAYFAGMWGWKGTTIGGIVLKLKVVRLDGGPVTFPVALVRGLTAAFSTVVMFLGFLWIAWDPEKQSWHDKIAGTVVVRLPHTQSLVCF